MRIYDDNRHTESVTYRYPIDIVRGVDMEWINISSWGSSKRRPPSPFVPDKKQDQSLELSLTVRPVSGPPENEQALSAAPDFNYFIPCSFFVPLN